MAVDGRGRHEQGLVCTGPERGPLVAILAILAMHNFGVVLGASGTYLPSPPSNFRTAF